MTSELITTPSLEQLRLRSSSKWRTYPADVLPLFVAETDFDLAPGIAETLARAVALGDTGYKPTPDGLHEAFTGFADRRFGWNVSDAAFSVTTDVIYAVVETLRAVVAPGDRVVINPPVYHPFFTLVKEVGASPELVPMQHGENGWRLDLDGIERALSQGAKAILLCSPHNPTGTVHSRDELASLADLAARYGVAVVSDEIHAPIVQPGTGFVPFLDVSDAAREVGYCVTSASKTFNLAGLKSAFILAQSDATKAKLNAMPAEVGWRAGHLGVLASKAAFDAASDPWLDAMLRKLRTNFDLLSELLDEHVPGARFTAPDATYLTWVDLSAVGWGDDPAKRILREARVAFNSGLMFGAEGAGYVRINVGTSAEILREAIERVGKIVSA